MNRDIAYTLALTVVGLAALSMGWSAIGPDSPPVASILLFLGGAALVLTSGYSLVRRREVAPGNDVAYWVVLIGAGLTLLGALLQLLNV